MTISEESAPDGSASLTASETVPIQLAPLQLAPLEPRDGVPEVITTREALAEYASRLATGVGPLALDAERASGYRYSQRAYLVQLRRDGAGTALIDPINLPDLSVIQEATAGVEWILHAATQDLACLAEIGLRPTVLFDTELAGRLLGREKVGLAALVAAELGEVLEKGHGSADWSLRPLTPNQLRYAALDVELLVELRDRMHTELEASGKLDWAHEEFAALVHFAPRDRGDDAWRRTSGIHRLRKARALGVVRSLWFARDEVARRSDIAQGRILPDAAIVAAATALPVSKEALGALKEFSGRGQQRRLPAWWSAVSAAMALPESGLPDVSPPPTGPPPPRNWPERNPEAFARLEAAKEALGVILERIDMPAENLLTPDLVRRLCWEPPDPATQAAIEDFLRDGGAREWQVGLTAAALAKAVSVAP
ncbi:MAG: HRDC domain-containing protein [Candidatus Nanopelagicales bacterium]